ncbi:hypothetical protein [Mucilaginibacter gilvus]|uniref:Uncharacterized protein n=1 Tax=Mucilaginibacter gilvus TaxID=2305909 RepID=A0A444MNC0_9SPHI|nr:hypothetical protein [Mucilaginibacter gilvus]RWY51195.1 hypothetical protein EPL05_14110 [Mucilaginibacter gilvus]
MEAALTHARKQNNQDEIAGLTMHLAAIEILKAKNVEKIADKTLQNKDKIKIINNEANQNELLNTDQAAIDAAKGQAAKLEAQKKLIRDKAAYEIELATDNQEKIKQINNKTNSQIDELDKQHEKQRAERAIQTAQTIANAAITIVSNNIKWQSDAKIKALERDKINELSNKNLTATQRKAIDDKYQKRENQEKVKAFKANQKVQVAQALINGAIGVQKTIAEWGMPFAIPSLIPVVASTAAQVATIVAQKPPAFAKGGHFVSDGRGALLPGYSRTDNTNAYLRVQCYCRNSISSIILEQQTSFYFGIK